MAVIAATAIRAAIRPYSMAVAPFLSAAKVLNMVFMGDLLCGVVLPDRIGQLPGGHARLRHHLFQKC